MPSVSLTTLGCKVNQYETQRILDSFESAGFAVVPFGVPSDVVVVNTCSVTGIAEGKSRYTVRRARRLSPGARIVVTGCAGQMALNQGADFLGADLLVPNPEKLDTYRRFAAAFPSLAALAESRPAPRPPVKPEGRTRATVKVQDGCSARCSYCSIPYTRPGMRSRPAEEVLAEVRGLAEKGYLEVVLTGVLIGAYGPETGSGGPRFEELVALLARESGIARVRISSIEMHQVTEPILELVGQGLVAPHLHIPLQSGDDGVLRDMNRGYSRLGYLALCERVRRELPRTMLTTDLMVGFPTETEHAFRESLDAMERARFLKTHVFRFSPRPGTPAEQWGDPVPDSVKQERSRHMQEEGERIGADRVRGFLGQTVRVLVEGRVREQGLLEGTSDEYLTVRMAGSPTLSRTFQWVRLDEERGGVAFGEVVSVPGPRLALA